MLAIGGLTLRCISFSFGGDFPSTLAILIEEVVDSFVFGSPVITGGGNSSPSAALRESCRAKSDACHHSRNLRAKIDVGSNILSEDASFGPATCVNVRLLKKELLWPGLAAVVGRGCVATAIALWSASPRRRIRVPISHIKGEWYLDESKRYARLNARREK